MGVDPKHLQLLFESFGNKDDRNFVRTAEAIIERELAANHHGYANALRHALKNQPTMTGPPTRVRDLSVVPRDRRSGEDLLWLVEPKVGLSGLVLGDEATSALMRFLAEQRARLRLHSHGLQPANRLLFWGPPGNGKSATALALGFELGLPVATVRIDSLISSFLGDTASHLSRIFSLATSSPMVLLFDEVDSIAKRRDDPRDVGELKRVVNALLQQIDRSTSSQSIFIAATNHQHLLDPAVWRRFDAVIEFPLPTEKQRMELLRRQLRDFRVNGSLTNAAKASSGMSFSDIELFARTTLKTMVIEERKSIDAHAITSDIRLIKKRNQRARK